MANLTYYNYQGVGTTNRKNFHYSQAVRVGDRIECAGQDRLPRLSFYEIDETLLSRGLPRLQRTRGWDPETGVFLNEINAQIDQAFANVDLNLATAGGTGWQQVFE